MRPDSEMRLPAPSQPPRSIAGCTDRGEERRDCACSHEVLNFVIHEVWWNR